MHSFVDVCVNIILAACFCHCLHADACALRVFCLLCMFILVCMPLACFCLVCCELCVQLYSYVPLCCVLGGRRLDKDASSLLVEEFDLA